MRLIDFALVAPPLLLVLWVYLAVWDRRAGRTILLQRLTFATLVAPLLPPFFPVIFLTPLSGPAHGMSMHATYLLLLMIPALIALGLGSRLGKHPVVGSGITAANLAVLGSILYIDLQLLPRDWWV